MGLLGRCTLSLAALVLVASSALAQQPQPVRIRGTVEKVDGNVVTIRSREGDTKVVTLTGTPAVTAMVKASLSDIKPGSYIGVSGMPSAKGVQKALGIHIFEDSQRGLGEGFREWDLQPNSSMTNATVAQKVAGTGENTITVTYKGGEKTVAVTPETPVVSFAPGDLSEVKPGAKVIVFAATPKPDGTLETNRIGVGRDGVTPPM
jgi:hypothetical protein